MDNLDINAVCFGILCNFAPVCGEDRAKEAANIVRQLQAENARLRAELEAIKAEKTTLVAAMLKIQEVVDVARIVFDGSSQEDLERRGPQKED